MVEVEVVSDQPDLSGPTDWGPSRNPSERADLLRPAEARVGTDAGDRDVADGGRSPLALPSGELRFPQKYGVTERELPRDVADHAVIARRYGETADALSDQIAEGLAAVEGLREQRRQAIGRDELDVAARLGTEIDGIDRRLSDAQPEALKVRYAEIDERNTAIADAKVQAAIWGRDRLAPDQVHPRLVVAQTFRDLADSERRMDDVLNVLGERAKLHLEEALDWASDAERESGADEPRRNRAVGFQGEVYQRLGNLKVGLAADNPGWITAKGTGAISNYETAAHLYRSIGDQEAARRVEQLADGLTPDRAQDSQGS